MKLIKDFAVLLSVAFVAFAFSNGVFPLFAQVDSASHLPFQESMRQDDTSKKFVWGPEEKKSYSQRKLDPQAWNMEMLAQDLAEKEMDWPTTVPIKYLPAPVPRYSNSG